MTQTTPCNLPEIRSSQQPTGVRGILHGGADASDLSVGPS